MIDPLLDPVFSGSFSGAPCALCYYSLQACPAGTRPRVRTSVQGPLYRKSFRPDLNREPAHYKCAALPLSYESVLGRAGIEPARQQAHPSSPRERDLLFFFQTFRQLPNPFFPYIDGGRTRTGGMRG